MIFQFNPVPQYTHFTIAGESFDLTDGLFGLAVSPKLSIFDSSINALFNSPRERVLYFHAMASGQENSVPLSVINNPLILLDPSLQASAFRNLGSRDIQTPAEAMDSNGNLFFVLINPLALVCWDTSLPYSPENIKIVERNDSTLQFASGMKIIRNLDGNEEIWIITIRFQVCSVNALLRTSKHIQ